MPSYVTHTIMARDVYNRLNNKDKVSLDYMLTYSLGGDLSKFSKCRKDTHNDSKELFFKNMCIYIKDNNLENDKEVLGLLYGHICHYALDDIAHPLIRKISKECITKGNNHRNIEMLYDEYIVDKKYNTELHRYNNNELFRGKINTNIKKLLNEVYKKTYNCNNLSNYYSFNIWLYKKIKLAYKLLGLNFIKIISGYNKFIKKNQIDFLNNKHKTTFIDYNKKESNESFEQLYNKSIEKALKDINRINEYLK